MGAALPEKPGADHPPVLAQDDISPNAKAGAQEWIQTALMGDRQLREVKTFGQWVVAGRGGL